MPTVSTKSPTTSTTTGSGGPATGPAKTPSATPGQDTVGNAALASNIAAPAAEGSSLLSDAATTKAPATTAKTGGKGAASDVATPKAKAAEPEKPADPVSRPSKFKKGANGALITGGPVTLTSDPGKGSKVATVNSGAAAKIEQLQAAAPGGGTGFLQVTVRQGEKNVKGWVADTAFSDQPGLAMDEDHEGVRQDLEWKEMSGDMSVSGKDKTPSTQGALGDCYLISSMAALHFANPDFAKRLVRYDEKKKRYIVTFYASTDKGRKPVEIEVDGYMPMEKSASNDPAYAGDVGPSEALWGAVVEKAYAKWKGGYDKIEGGDGGEAMEEMTGATSKYKTPSSMKEADVVPYFEKAQKDGLAIYAGVVNSVKVDKQTPLSGSDAGPYTGTLSQQHSWNEVQVDTLQIVDGSKKVATAHDQGEEEAKTGKIVGTDVKSGEVGYKNSSVKVEYKAGKAPKTAKDLEVHFETHGVVLPSKMLIGNHAYAFSGVVGGELQFYNPWGSYQPKPISPKEFLTYFDSLSTNQIPKAKTGG